MYLNDFLLEHCKDDNVASIIKNLSDAAIIISNQIKNVDKKVNSEVNLGNKNADCDLQKPLDIFADDILINCLKGCPVSGYASEEQDGFIDFKNDHNLIVLADPLDGSSNIDVNVTIGTIFSIISTVLLSILGIVDSYIYTNISVGIGLGLGMQLMQI